MKARGVAAAAALLLSACVGTADAQVVDPAPPPAPALLVGGPGEQTEVSLDGTLLAYRDENTIRWLDLATNATGAASVHPDRLPRVPDVSGSRIGYREVDATFQHGRAMLYDVALGGLPADVTPHPAGVSRNVPRIGGDTAAWQEVPLPGENAEYEIKVADLATGVVTALTDDALFDAGAEVSPDGSVVVWRKCDISSLQECDVWEAVRDPAGLWVSRQVTSGPRREGNPVTDGRHVAYLTVASGGTDREIAVQPVGGGPERVLALPGHQISPRIDEGLVTFLSEDADPDSPLMEATVWDLPTDTLRTVVAPGLTSNDWTATQVNPSGAVRLVFSRTVTEADGDDLYTVAFQRPAAGPVLTAAVRGPVNADGSSTFNARRGTVPVRFELSRDGTPSCELPPARIRVTRLGATTEQVDESVYSSPADSGGGFRVADCLYAYNLAASNLGAGRYRVEVLIDGTAAGAAEFSLR